jgi:hypothetical protein
MIHGTPPDLLKQLSGSKPAMFAIIFANVSLLAEKAMDRVQRTHVFVLLVSLSRWTLRQSGHYRRKRSQRQHRR